MKKFAPYLILASGSAFLGFCLNSQPPSPPPLPTQPVDPLLQSIVSNAVRACAEDYTRAYVRSYARSFIAEMRSNNIVQPCEHNWVPLRNYQQEHFCNRCGSKEWK